MKHHRATSKPIQQDKKWIHGFHSLTTVTVTVNIQIEANLVNDCWFLLFFSLCFSMKCFADLEDQNFHPLFCSRFLFTVEDMVSSIIVGKRLSNLPQR